MKTETLHCQTCNAPFQPDKHTTGYAVTQDNRKICYACADAMQREDLKDRSKPFYAYVSEDLRAITSWTGGKLMTISWAIPCKLTRQSWTHDARSYKSIRATDCCGKHWYGRGSAGICITLRPCK